VTPTQALTIYHVHHTEQEPVLDTDLVNLATAFPTMEPVLMELQFRRTETARYEDELDSAQDRIADLEERLRDAEEKWESGY
jgi:predicted  nucleic acid-binding Zn-ribbon protein